MKGIEEMGDEMTLQKIMPYFQKKRTREGIIKPSLLLF